MPDSAAHVSTPLPADYRERVYAGVLGKIIGVYLGRPFEGWTHERVMAELGPITGYVHERFGAPLVVTDDDIAGTFTFLRALEEHGVRPDLSSEEIGRTWLNTIVENRAILWWGGNGTSTEHTAWLNLRRGIPAPLSGSADVNGRTLAEQIGAQIFIDGWAMVAPGRPELAARLAAEAARVGTTIVDLGHRLAGAVAPTPPKNGAPFHFSLPGSVQGFAADAAPGVLSVGNEDGRLALRFRALAPGQRVGAMTPTFSPHEAPAMRSYELMACPLIYPGQRLEAACSADGGNDAPVKAGLRIKVYGGDDALETVDGPVETLAPGRSAVLAWTLPDTGGQPIAEVGFVLSTEAAQADGTVHVDSLRWDGVPTLRLRRPDVPGEFWRRAWVNGVSQFSTAFPAAFRLSQNAGEGIVIHGTRDWRDYAVSSDVTVHLAHEAGLAARVRGLRRYYALLLYREGKAKLVKVRDDERTVLAEEPFSWELERPYALRLTASGPTLAASIDGRALFEVADESDVFESGGIGLLISEGALSTPEVRIGAA